MTNDFDYGYGILEGIPQTMAAWGMFLELPMKSSHDFGEYILVDVEQAGIELHHQVEVIDESGDPLAGVWVIFGYPGGGPPINLTPTRNYWPNAPAVLRGNAQRTPRTGYVQHTFNEGGESIWIWDLNEEGVLKFPSPIVRRCNWVGTPHGHFEHTGVKLTFQRRANGIMPRQWRLAELERRITALEQEIKHLAGYIGS